MTFDVDMKVSHSALIRSCPWPGAVRADLQDCPGSETARSVAVRVIRLIAFGLSTALLFIGSPGISNAATPAVSRESIEVWKAFRKAQPFQVQQILVTTDRKATSRTLIFAEPPPKLTVDMVATILSRDLIACGVEQWSVMSGGSVADIVCSLKTGASNSLSESLAQLQLESFGSSEFAPVVALPAPARAMIKSSLDLKFNATDLHRWLTADTASFRSSPLASPVTLQEMLQGSARGVFTSSSSRLVVWAVDRSASLDNSSADIRKFAVRSDLVLGAMADPKTVLIVGRGRIEPIAHLPPLRSETVLLLAGSDQQHLEQSYERNDILAGKSGDGVDRAPILLSPQLVDTEFGTLLNVADQLLKGWSMAGQVHYAKFNYPKPKTYPFGTVPAAYVEPGRESFLFNWNTDGAAYRQQIKGLDVVIPQRTGSLSVIYGDPKDRPRGMEDKAYGYFSSSGDVTLARVVQYTSLYQIFRQFGLKAEKPVVSPRYARFTADLDEVTKTQFKTILSDMTDAEVQVAVQEYWTAFVARVQAAKVGESGSTRKQLAESLAASALTTITVLRKAERDSGGKVSGALADWARGLRRRQAPNEAQKRQLAAALTILTAHIKENDLELLLADNAYGLRNTGMLQAALDRTSGWTRIGGTAVEAGSWNHTAYVVESMGAGHATGGHNLDAPMIRFADAPNVAKGQISVTREADGTISVFNNPGDSNRLRAIARDVGTRKALTKEQIETEVSNALKNAKVEPPVSLQAIRAVDSHAIEFSALSSGESAYTVRSLSKSEQDVLAPLLDQQAIVMEQRANGSFILSRTGSPDAVDISSMTAATDALANAMIQNAGANGPVSVFVRGMKPEKAEAILTFVQSNLARYPKPTVDHVLSFGGSKSLLHERPKLLNASIAHNGLRVDRDGIKVTRITSGHYEGYSRVEVPLVATAKAPWYVRLIFIVKDISSAGIEKLANRVNALLVTLPIRTSPARVHSIVKNQILADMKELNIDSILLSVDSKPTNRVHDLIVGDSGVHRRASA